MAIARGAVIHWASLRGSQLVVKLVCGVLSIGNNESTVVAGI